MLSEIILAVVIVSLLFERYHYSKQMNKELVELAKLVKAKDTGEYAVMKSVDSARPSLEIKEPEYVPSDALSDDQFFESIRKQNAR